MGLHDTNGMFVISEEALRTLIRAVVQNGIGVTFLNAVAYTQFAYDPVRIQLVARLLNEENGAAGAGRGGMSVPGGQARDEVERMGSYLGS
jgi:hypothetical protein